MKKNLRALEWTLFSIYMAVMVWLLFLERLNRIPSLPYGELIHSNINLVPFRTMRLFFDNYAYMPRAAMINLLGNVVVFIPAGLFFPCLWRRQRNFFLFFITMTLSVSAVETVQLFTLLGSCDIDDLILNLMGATIGFIIFSIPPIKRGLNKIGFIKQ